MATITFGSVHVYLSKRELVNRLFPNLPKELVDHVEVTQNEGPDGKAELGFEFQLFPEANPEQLDELREEVARLALSSESQKQKETRLANMEPSLGARELNILYKEGIRTFEQLLALSPGEVRNLRRHENFGKVALARVEEFIKIHSATPR